MDVEVRHADLVRRALNEGCGVLITPNHCSHADGLALCSAAEHVGTVFYAMMAWQVFARGSWLRQQILRQHGAFSVDREGTDMTALRKAREILEEEPHPLVIFPEGEVYHLNERLTPFREGAATIALLAAKKGSRPIACVPCALRYYYIQDPLPELNDLMGRLERELHWRSRPDLNLDQRIYHLAEGALALKEVEVLGRTGSGPIPDRIRALIEFVLGRVEARQGVASNNRLTVPERVKAARKLVIAKLNELPPADSQGEALYEDLDDLFFVVQAFSYPGDYVSEKPSVERMAETLDKFEEDLLDAPTATIRGARRVVVTFADPILLQPSVKLELTPADLTQQIQDRVAALLAECPRDLQGNRNE